MRFCAFECLPGARRTRKGSIALLGRRTKRCRVPGLQPTYPGFCHAWRVVGLGTVEIPTGNGLVMTSHEVTLEIPSSEPCADMVAACQAAGITVVKQEVER